MTQHTQGPWTTPDWAKLKHIHVVDSNGLIVAAVYNRVTPGEQAANARVIAVAPEMLAALTAIATAPAGAYSRDKEQYLKNVIEWCQERARAAIAKAQGG